MPSLNKIILVGRLTRDPEPRTTTSGLTIATFSIAVDRQYKDQGGERKTDFFRCKAFRQTADFVTQYVTKGNLVAVEGRVEINEVVGQDGAKRYFTDVVCDRVEQLQPREGGGGSYDEEGGGYSAAPQRNAAPASKARGGDDEGYFDDDEPAPRPARAAAPAPAQRSAPAPAPKAAAPARKPAPAASSYPDDDFDDSDPFADE